jgi:hypothetical protein
VPGILTLTGIVMHGIDPQGLGELAGLGLIAAAHSVAGIRVLRATDAT